MKRFSLGTWSIALALLACLAVVGCERVQDPPQPGSNVEIPAIEWRVRDSETLAAQYAFAGKEVATAQRTKGTQQKTVPAQVAAGFAGWTHDGRFVVYTLPPKYVDDDVACTLGHEVMHAALGDYHVMREAK